MHDLIVKAGTVIDGTGEPAFTADVAIDGGRITEVGRVDERAGRVIDADGLLVTPGVVDIHTHYDGQATWDPRLLPSGWHGVTTAVMGNCGVGFAPCRPDEHDWLIGLMEGVEDIPGSALAEGMTWGWETFPEYLDLLERMPRTMDVGAQVPHGAVRAYVMGERGARNEPATPDDITNMAAVVREALEAGALGFSTSRTILHRAVDGEPVPGTFAAEDELLGLASALGDVGRGIFELAPAGIAGEDLLAPDKEMDWMRRVSAQARCPITYLLIQNDAQPEHWREMLKLTTEAAAEGARLVPQVGGRTLSVIFGHQTANHPFAFLPTYKDELADVPLPQRLSRFRDPELKRRLLEERPAEDDLLASVLTFPAEKVYMLGSPPDYEPAPEQSVAARAARAGREPRELLYDLMLEDDGRELFMHPLLNYSDRNLDCAREWLQHPLTVLGGSDSGAHVGGICDASIPTWMLTHWSRDRTRGERLPLEWVVKKQTHDTARLYGLEDRGTIRAGQKADLNVVDYQSLALHRPEVVFDLPGGSRRIMQGADGYVATIVTGEPVLEHGQDTGARPGRVVRGGRGASIQQ